MPPLPPARILAALNRGLIGQMRGGFVTCCAVRIAPDGIATIANAGHLAPYLDGREIELRAAFPLGITAEAEFEESTLALLPGARPTLLTDGVVEAQNADGSSSASTALRPFPRMPPKTSPVRLSTSARKTTSPS